MPELLCPELDLPHPHGILDGRRLLLHGRDKTKHDGERNGDLPPNVHPAKCGNALAGRGGFDDVGPHHKGRKQSQDQSHQQDYQHIDDHGKLDGVLDSLHKQPRCEQAEEHRCRLILPVSQQQDKGNHRHRDHKGGVAV